jgi:uncharacterized protein with PQ loop repeat
MKKKGFYKMAGQAKAAAIIFFVISIGSFLPFVRETMLAGISLTMWILSALALFIPIYSIITDNIAEKKSYKV